MLKSQTSRTMTGFLASSNTLGWFQRFIPVYSPSVLSVSPLRNTTPEFKPSWGVGAMESLCSDTLSSKWTIEATVAKGSERSKNCFTDALSLFACFINSIMDTASLQFRQAGSHASDESKAWPHQDCSIGTRVDHFHRSFSLHSNMVGRKPTYDHIQAFFWQFPRILAVLPLSCLMIIFDLVVHNPEYPETALSLALLDIAGGHFSRLEFASKGTLPGSLLAQFAHLARQYVVDQRQRKRQINQENLSTLSMKSELPSAVPATTLAIENPQIATQHAASASEEQMLASSQAFLVPESISTPRWNVGSTDDSENQLFIPLIDDPSYRVEDLGLLGIDLKYLFDFPHFNPGTESGMWCRSIWKSWINPDTQLVTPVS